MGIYVCGPGGWKPKIKELWADCPAASRCRWRLLAVPLGVSRSCSPLLGHGAAGLVPLSLPHFASLKATSLPEVWGCDSNMNLRCPELLAWLSAWPLAVPPASYRFSLLSCLRPRDSGKCPLGSGPAAPHPTPLEAGRVGSWNPVAGLLGSLPASCGVVPVDSPLLSAATCRLGQSLAGPPWAPHFGRPIPSPLQPALLGLKPNLATRRASCNSCCPNLAWGPKSEPLCGPGG